MNSKQIAKKLALVHERDGPTCHICQQKTIYPSSDRNDPFRATLDHLIPSIKGGSNHLDNLAIAHQQCNGTRQHNDLDIEIKPTMLREGFDKPLTDEEVENLWREKNNAAIRGEYISKKRSPRRRQRSLLRLKRFLAEKGIILQ